MVRDLAFKYAYVSYIDLLLTMIQVARKKCRRHE